MCVCVAGHVLGAKQSPGSVYVSRGNWRFLQRVSAKGIATSRAVMTRHGLFHREETYIPPARGYIFPGRAGSAKDHMNYIAVYYNIKELAPMHLRKLIAGGAKHDPRIADLTPTRGTLASPRTWWPNARPCAPP